MDPLGILKASTTNARSSRATAMATTDALEVLAYLALAPPTEVLRHEARGVVQRLAEGLLVEAVAFELVAQVLE